MSTHFLGLLGAWESNKTIYRVPFGRVTLEVYVTKNVSELFGVKNEVSFFFFFFTETHP